MDHLACIQVFLVHFSLNTGWPKASECPKMHIYGQMRAHWSKSIGANSITIIKGPKWGPCRAQNNVKWVSKNVFKCVSSIFHETSQLTSNGPKGPIYGQMRALWGHQRPQLSVKLLFNGSSTMHSNVFDPFFIKNEPTCWSKTREGPKRSFRAKWGPFGLTYQTWKWRFLKIGSCELLVTS